MKTRTLHIVLMRSHVPYYIYDAYELVHECFVPISEWKIGGCMGMGITLAEAKRIGHVHYGESTLWPCEEVA